MAQVKSLQTGIKFKDTPIGKIPVDWEVRKVEDIGDIVTGSTPRTEVKEYYGNKYMFVTAADMNDFKYVKRTARMLSDEGMKVSRRIPKDSVMVVCIASIGKLAMSFEDCSTNQQINSIICNETANSHFIYYLISSKISQLSSLSGKTAVPIVNKGLFSKLLIQLPHLEEQKKIAEILTTVDDGIEETDRIIEKIKELKKGLMQKLLTRGIGHKKFKKTEIGEIPEEWEVIKLDKVVKEFFNGGTPDTKFKKYWDGNIPWVTGADFINQRIELIRRYITLDGVKNSATNIIPKGNLLIVTRTGVGKLAIAPFDIAISQDITGVITDIKRVRPDFVYRFLDYHEKKLKSFVQGTSINGLLREDLASLSISIPPLKEQKEIVNVFTAIDLEIDNEEANKQNLETLKKSLMQVLLTGKVRVKLH